MIQIQCKAFNILVISQNFFKKVVFEHLKEQETLFYNDYFFSSFKEFDSLKIDFMELYSSSTECFLAED